MHSLPESLKCYPVTPSIHLKMLAIIAINAAFWILIFLLVYGLTVVISVAFTVRHISRSLQDCFRDRVQVESDQNIPPLPSQSHQSSERAATTPAFTRPSLHRRKGFLLDPPLDPDGFILESLPLALDSDSSSTSGSQGYETAREDWEVDSSATSDSEGYDTAPEDAAPATTMAETRALEAFDAGHQEMVSHQTSPSSAMQTELTNSQVEDLHETADCDEVDAGLIMRRNIKMREEGVRVKVNYSQLASLKPVPTAAGSLRGGAASRTTSPPTSSSSPPSSCPSTTPPASGLRTPAPTPENHQDVVAPVLPTMGPAAGQDILHRVDEKLLAIPADAVSRRLLRDGRYILRHGKRQPRSAAAAEGSSSQQVAPSPVAAEGGLQSPASDVWYPSELNE